MTGNNPKSWYCWGASAIGKAHINNNIVNQDSYLAFSQPWGNIIVVADGLGSKKYSDHGSKMICHAVLEGAKQYSQYQQADFNDILKLIHLNWLISIAPFHPKDCATTCLFAIQLNDTLTLGRLGDGAIAVYAKTEKESFILDDKKEDSFINSTVCISQKTEPAFWEIQTIKSSDCQAVVLYTDGLSNDIESKNLLTFTEKLYLNYVGMKAKKRKREVKQWLTDWSDSKLEDDKTIACLFNKRILKNERK